MVDAQTETRELQLKARMGSSFTELFHPAHCLLTAALQLPKDVYQKYFTKPSACALPGISTGEHPLCHHSRTYSGTGKAPKILLFFPNFITFFFFLLIVNLSSVSLLSTQLVCSTEEEGAKGK